jgi:LysM repeat protein
MRQNRIQQAVAGLAVAVAVVATLIGGLILAAPDGFIIGERTAVPTSVRINTLPPTEISLTPTSPRPTPSVTSTVLPTSVPPTNIPLTKTSTITKTPSPVATSTRTPTSASCNIMAGWKPYSVRSGDTLFIIGLQYGLRVDTLMKANCLTSTWLEVGDIVYIPPVTPMPLPALTTLDPPDPINTTAAPTGTQTATDGACTNPDSVITSPKVGAIMSGRIAIKGTARVPNFAFYKVEIRQEGSGKDYAILIMSSTQIVNGKLADLDTSVFPNGEFWLRLVVVDSDGNYPERCALLVTFKNP